MFNMPIPTDPDLLKTLLDPLLEDFQYWFERSHTLLTDEHMEFMEPGEQQELLNRVTEMQKSVSVMQSLMSATNGQAGVDMKVLMDWHRLVHECWGVSMKHRQSKEHSA